ncbi:hypothetical protein ACLKA7_002069 [Drosophila subpalustris]
MDSPRGDAAVPSELKSAINIALFQAQQTYMAAMDTQFSEYKAMFRQEMLAFMAQIRETVRNIYSGDPVPSEQQQLRALIELPTALMAKETECLLDKWHNEALKSQQEQEPMLTVTYPPPETAQRNFSDVGAISQHIDEQTRPTEGSPGSSITGYVELRSDPENYLEQNTFQAEYGFGKGTSWLILRSFRQQGSRTGLKEKRVNEADDPQPGIDPGTDPVVEALYRPRAGGGAKSGCGNWMITMIMPG